jgi:hypothetical protein
MYIRKVRDSNVVRNIYYFDYFFSSSKKYRDIISIRPEPLPSESIAIHYVFIKQSINRTILPEIPTTF